MTPQPAWWLGGYGIGLTDISPLSCLSGNGVAVLAYDIWGDIAWLTVLDEEEWTIIREFDLDVDGKPYFVSGTSKEEIVVFSFPSPPGGMYLNGGNEEPLVLPDYGVLGTSENGHGVRGLAGDEEHGYFAVGYWKKSADVEESGFVWRSDDLHTWEEMGDVPHMDSTIYSEHFIDVCIADNGTVYVVGNRGDVPSTPDGENQPLVLRYDGLEWIDEAIPPAPGAEQPGWEKLGELDGVWCHGGHVYAVGTISPKGIVEPGVLHYAPPEDL